MGIRETFQRWLSNKLGGQKRISPEALREAEAHFADIRRASRGAGKGVRVREGKGVVVLGGKPKFPPGALQSIRRR